MPDKRHKTVTEDYFDSVKSAIKSIKAGFGHYSAAFSGIKRKIAHLDSDVHLPREISTLLKNAELYLEFANSLNNKKVEEKFMKDMVAIVHEKELKYVGKVWNKENYQEDAAFLRELLVATIGEYFVNAQKKPSPQVYAKYYPLFNMSKTADITEVVTAINNILKNDNNHPLVSLLQKNLNEKFGSSHKSQLSPLRFEKSRSHKPQIIFDIRMATANVYKEFFKDSSDIPYRLAETATELEGKAVLTELREKLAKFKNELKQRARMKKLIESLDTYINNMETYYANKIEEDLIFGILFKDIKKQFADLRKPGLPPEEFEKRALKIEDLKKNLDHAVIGEDARILENVYKRIKNLIIGSPDLKNTLGKMLTFVQHVDTVSKDQKPETVTKLEILGKDAREYLSLTPKKSQSKFFANEQVRSLSMNVQSKIFSFLKVVGLISAKTLADRNQMLDIKKDLDSFKLPNEIAPTKMRESTRIHAGSSSPAGAIYKRPKR